MYFPTPKTIRDAYERSDKVLAKADGQLGSVNISDVLDKIIRAVGRFTESYAGDALYEIKYVQQLTDKHAVEPHEDCIIPFGIRRNGVDGTGFVMSRLVNDCYDRFSTYVHPERTYRKILAVRVVTDFGTPLYCLNHETNCTVELKDITDDFIHLADGEDKWTYEKCLEAHGSKLYRYVSNHRAVAPGEKAPRNPILTDSVAERLCDYAELYTHQGRIPGIDEYVDD